MSETILTYWNNFEDFCTLDSLLCNVAKLCETFAKLNPEEKNNLKRNGYLDLLIKIKNEGLTIAKIFFVMEEKEK